jgi:hypothetical protein
MNYRYEIHNRRYVRETREDNQFFIWSIEQIKNNQSEFHDREYKESYLRTQKWTLENHPELLL